MSVGRTPDADGEQSGGPARPALAVLLLALLAAQTSNQTLAPLLAPFGREVGLGEVQIGLVMTASAATFSFSSLWWGRRVDLWGTRRVLLLGMSLAVLGLASFAVVANLALAVEPAPGLTWFLMVITRSVVFGLGMGAIPVAAMSHIAATTVGSHERTAGLGKMGSMQGVALVLGPALGGLLAFAGLLGPVWAPPFLLAAVMVVVARKVPPIRTSTAGTVPGRSSLRPWDPRVRSFLLVGFAVFASLGMVVIVLGFAFQDRLHLDGAETVRYVGAATFCSGLVMFSVQGFLVPRLRWEPVRLMRCGVPVVAVGLVGLAVADSFVTLAGGLMVMMLGIGLAIPGYSAGTTLQVEASEQGAVAGLINATNGLTFMLGPVVGTALYNVGSALPMVAGVGLCLMGLAVLWTRPMSG